ncbi:MAG TPA: hypothetical protein VMF08_09235 [Candidatus Sulfotelmatobacter sp.]|nr:hypothetical protein [Candidatus Sulfotelmatobacter sp.]
MQSLSPNFEAHRTSVVSRLERTLLVVDRLLKDPDLANPKLEPNFFMDFKRLSELVLNVEDSSLLILKRCSQEDRFLSALLQQICREVGYKDPAPLCGALSFQYFQALMGMDIIMTPQTQASELLALPDLYHELAHFVLFRRRSDFEVPLLGLIHKFFADAIRKGKQQGLPKASLEIIRDNHALWTSSWHVEFACDMVATYWCGPSYGLANLRLSATRGDPYQDSATHPADDARRAGIECILKLAGDSKAASEIDRAWLDLKRLSPSVQPPGYAKRYSTRLLEKLAESIYTACSKAGFKRFADQRTQASAVVCRTVSEAWDAFQRDATTFPAFESSAIAKLKKQLSLP